MAHTSEKTVVKTWKILRESEFFQQWHVKSNYRSDLEKCKCENI